MFIGRIGACGQNQVSLIKQAVNRMQTQQTNTRWQKNYDVASFSTSTDHTQDSGIYHKSNGLKYLTPESITYAEKKDTPDLSVELLPPAEREYTEKAALLNQYGKQFRFDLRLIKDENGEYTSFEGEGGCLFSPDMVSADELEDFRQTLVKQGLGDEIDWDGVTSDLYLNHIDFGNAQRLEMKTDYLASRYVTLKKRIETDYTSDEKEEQMNKLNDVYENAKKMLVDSYADTIGGFFEDLGLEGISKDMKDSLIAAVDQRVNEYEGYISEKGNSYAKITNPEDQWLYQDDGFMAAQLRESMSQSEPGDRGYPGNSNYSYDDLQFAGRLAKTLNEQLTYWNGRDRINKDKDVLEEKLTAQYDEIESTLSKIGITDKMKSVFQESFRLVKDRLIA